MALDREKALKDAEAALVAYRQYRSDRVIALVRGASIEEADRWREAWPPQQKTEIETVVDAVLALVRPAAGITLTPDEAQRATSWWDMLDVRFGVYQSDLDLVRKLEASS